MAIAEKLPGLPTTGPITNGEVLTTLRRLGLGDAHRATAARQANPSRPSQNGEILIHVFELPRVFTDKAAENALRKLREDPRFEVAAIYKPRPDKLLVATRIVQNPVPVGVIAGAVVLLLAGAFIFVTLIETKELVIEVGNVIDKTTSAAGGLGGVAVVALALAGALFFFRKARVAS